MRRAALLLAAALLPVPALAAPETEHVVRPGETLNGIANRAGISSKALADANGLQAPFALRTGQKLRLPPIRKTSDKPPASVPARIAGARPSSAGQTQRTAPMRSTPTRSTPTASAGAFQQENVHVVVAGETLGGIANRAKVPRVLIAEANGLAPPYEVQPGRKLLIPRTRHYVVAPGDTGFDIAYKHAVPWDQIAVANGLDANAPVKPGRKLLIPTIFDPQLPSPADRTATRDAAAANAVATAAVAAIRAPSPSSSPPSSSSLSSSAGAPRFGWPLSGDMRRGFRSRDSSDHHDGLDIRAPYGTAVKAAAAGTVLFAGAEAEQFGNLVVVDHGGGWNTAYGFLSKVTVAKGAKIAKGERLGLVGNTGKAKDNELHFEVRQDGVPVDPQARLPKAP